MSVPAVNKETSVAEVERGPEAMVGVASTLSGRY